MTIIEQVPVNCQSSSAGASLQSSSRSPLTIIEQEPVYNHPVNVPLHNHRAGASLRSSSGAPGQVRSGQAAGMSKKAKAPKASDAEAAQDVVPAAAGEDWSCKLITGSPTEVSLQHPAFTHALVVNTSAVSALASRGRLLGPWVAKGPGPCTLCGAPAHGGPQRRLGIPRCPSWPMAF